MPDPRSMRMSEDYPLPPSWAIASCDACPAAAIGSLLTPCVNVRVGCLQAVEGGEGEPDALKEMHEGIVYKYFVNGTWRVSTSGRTIQNLTPYDETVCYEVQACTRAEIDEAYTTAAAAQLEWARTPLWQRAELLHRAAAVMRQYAAIMATPIVREVGKNRKSAVEEVKRTADLLDYAAEEGVRVAGTVLSSDSFVGQKRDKFSVVERVPVGVVLCIPPFNYPVNLCGSKIGPALIAGNAVVIKTPTQGAVSTLHLAACFKVAGAPPGLINIVTGKGSEIGDYLVQHAGAQLISFTGGSTGIDVCRKAGMVPLQMELGGKDAAIICPDADLELAATAIVKGAFSYSGQRCTAVKIVFAVGDIAQELLDRVMAKKRKLTIGHPEENADITAVINRKSADYIESLVMDAQAKGATLTEEYRREGNLIHPLVIDHVTEDMKIHWEEPFGPVLPFVRVASVEEAVALANRSSMGLQGCVFTADINRAISVANAMTTGTVQINGPPARGPDHFPFQGFKDSGIGTQGIRYSIESMTKIKSYVINLPAPSFARGI
jgi:glyceraldehyde-3-phosphate dehydrogenase (NADP+)